MTAWLSVLVPLLLMFFALGMERVESRLRESTVRQDELEEFLEQPRPDEVRALFRRARAARSSCSGSRNRDPREPSTGRAASAAAHERGRVLTRFGPSCAAAARQTARWKRCSIVATWRRRLDL